MCSKRSSSSVSVSGWICFLSLLATFCSPYSAYAVDRNTGLDRKLIVGYQGWFGCPDDFGDNKNWQHWFVNATQPQNFTVDYLPSLREFNTKDLCATRLRRPDGGPVYLYSAQNRNVVSTHFRWMQEHGIDGAAIQRFVGAISDKEKRQRSDNVFRNVIAAAKEHGRVFFVVYDVSGANPVTVVDDVRDDWRHLVRDLKLTESPGYLFDHGKPVLELWGFGFVDRPGTADEVAELIRDLKNGRKGLPPATLIGGVPTNWRTLSGDSKSNPAWAAIYRSYDVISPWSVGRFSDDAGADAFVQKDMKPDLAETKRLGLGYMPVIFPGFSWYNLMTNRNQQNRAILNQVPRRCGNFLWRQVFNTLQAGNDMLYAAMFDEVDEGTALFPVETHADKLPVGARMVTLNQDGCSLPDDWYLRVIGKAGEYLRNRQVPPRELNAVIRP